MTAEEIKIAIKNRENDILSLHKQIEKRIRQKLFLENMLPDALIAELNKTK